jgi:hypothetical protein
MIKAKDIYNMYNDYSFGYEMYVFLPASAEGKTLTLTSNLKKYEDCEYKLFVQYCDERCVDLSKVKCDIKRGDNLWINLRLRKFKINTIDIFNELVLSHFEIDKETGKIIFVFNYKGGEL